MGNFRKKLLNNQLMKKIFFPLFCIAFSIIAINVQAQTPQKIKPVNNSTNMTISDSRFSAIEKRLTELERENAQLKQQVNDLTARMLSITSNTDKKLEQLKVDLLNHSHSMKTNIAINGGVSFKPYPNSSPMFFVTGKSEKKDVETGPAILKEETNQ